jgi:transposase
MSRGFPKDYKWSATHREHLVATRDWLTADQLKAVVAEIQTTRLPYSEIAERWLIHERTVTHIAKRYRVSRRPFLFSAKRDQELRDAILNNRNLSFLALARKLGVSYTSIFKRAKDMGIKTPYWSNRARWSDLTEEQRTRFLTLCRSSHATYREIGKIFGFRANLVSKYAQRNGINRLGRNRTGHSSWG